MTRGEFDVLIRRLEASSRRHPRLYTARLVALVALAYGYLLLILVGSLILAVAMIVMIVHVPVTAKLGLFGLVAFGGMFWAVLRGLWVKLTPPTGMEVPREQAPRLFDMLDELRSVLDTKPFHKVLVIGDMNAAVVQIPRLGVFGWHKNYLLLGLPLMQSLAPDEFKAVLAHEFAHSSRGHGRFGNWLYRVRRTWEQVFQQMARQRTRFGAVLYKFINWYWPIFNGHAFVLARANEYEADACSVRLAGADVAANALMRLPVNATLLSEKFWPEIFKRVKKEKEPPTDVILSLAMALKIGPKNDDAQKRLSQSFLMETNNADTHPSLKDRLRAIGRLPVGFDSEHFTIPPPPTPRQSAAEVLLGSQAEVLARSLSEEWRNAVRAEWNARHNHAQKLAEELALLETQGNILPTAEELWEKASRVIQLHSDREALPLIEQLLAMKPAHPSGNFVLGRIRLEAEDASGVAFIEKAMDADPELTQDGCQILYTFCNRHGQREKIKDLERRMDKFREITALAQRERAQISADNTFIPHELLEAQLATLRMIFASEVAIGSVAVARKQVAYFKKNPCFVIGLDIKAPWWKPRSATANRKLVNRVLKRLNLPGYFLVFVNEKNRKGLWTKISTMPSAMVYIRATKRQPLGKSE